MRKILIWKCRIFSLLFLVYHISGTAVPETYVEGVIEESVSLPCDVLPKQGDRVEFVFWYKNDGVTALYTVDARDDRAPTHLRNDTYGDRVKFYSDPPHLQMDLLKEDDSGAYFCRVDYQWSATEIKRVNLIVVVPPKELIIRDDHGQTIRDIAGPYKEKSDVSLFCEAQNGSPSPNVTWWKDNKLWDNTFHRGTRDGTVVNEMRLTNLSRHDLLSTFHCRAQNTKLVPPTSNTIILDLHLYPINVKLTGATESLSAGNVVKVACESWGSRPAAILSWWLNGTQLSDHNDQTRDNATASTLNLLPKRQHHRTQLVCRAENPKMVEGRLEATRMLNVTYIPQVALRLIKEDADRQPKEYDFVRLVCEADANPQVFKVGWLLEDVPLPHNESRTDITSGSTLVFKRLTRRNKGRYCCYAINEEGKGFSQELTLNISHSPVCKANQQITYVVALNESVVVRCELEAQPSDVMFKWEFSNTVHKHYNLQHRSEGLISYATYTPLTTADYGTLFCWANNSIGNQQSSCFFTVIAPACKTEKANANASTSPKEGIGSTWHHSAITACAGIAALILIVIFVCSYYCRKIYIEKKHRPMAQQILDEEVSIYTRVQCQNAGPQPRILIAK